MKKLAPLECWWNQSNRLLSIDVTKCLHTLHFTDFGVFDKRRMDAVIETAVRKLGYSEAKEFQTKSIEEFVYRKHVFASVLLYRYVLNARERGCVINSHIPLAQLFLHSFPRVGRTRLQID